MARPLPALLLTLALGSGAVAAERPPYVDAASGVAFPAEQAIPGSGRPLLRAVGSVLRQRFGFDEYTLCLYVDLEALRAKAKGLPRDPVTLGRLLAAGDVAQAYHAAYLRGVGAGARSGYLVDGLRNCWPGSRFDPESSTVRAFVAYIRQDVKKGDLSELWFDGRGTLVTRLAGGTPTRIADPDLCRAFITIYMGEPNKEPALRQALLAQLPALLDAEPVRKRR